MPFEIDRLSSCLLAQFPDIAFAYLFGSAKEGVVKEGSDVDVALYYTGNDIFIRFKVAEALEKVLPGLIFDLVELKKADPILSFEAIRSKLLFVRPEAMDCYLHFYTLTCRKYEDQIFWMKKQLAYRGYEVQWSD
ncbi:MAG: nucleotidyltransferase domain-containing protein [Prevotellaceae bacterium]|jgi:predicted nucleotidyltransferase|nr:nucleotidyltransferase domain-containing protein [Prevotellaceae bacterium]